jgi:hypothetical protein
MSLKPCKECGNMVSTDAKNCPQCGARLKMTLWAKIIIVFVFFAALSALSQVYNSMQDSNPNIPPERIEQKAKGMSLMEIGKYSKSLSGREVNWKGKIVSIKNNKITKNYTINIDTNNRDNLRVICDIDDSQSMILKEGASYNISGQIEGVTNVLGITIIKLNNVKLNIQKL